MTLETSIAHKEIKSLRNSLSKQAGSATCFKGQQPLASVLPRAWEKASVSDTPCEEHSTRKPHAQIWFQSRLKINLQTTEHAKPQRALKNRFSTFRNTNQGRSSPEKAMSCRVSGTEFNIQWNSSKLTWAQAPAHPAATETMTAVRREQNTTSTIQTKMFLNSSGATSCLHVQHKIDGTPCWQISHPVFIGKLEQCLVLFWALVASSSQVWALKTTKGRRHSHFHGGLIPQTNEPWIDKQLPQSTLKLKWTERRC